MSTCTADNNKRCVHECDGDFCRAYYHHREDRCFGTCDPKTATNFLQTQLVYHVARNGWVSASSADLKKVPGVEIAQAAVSARILASEEPENGEVESSYVQSVIEIADGILGFLAEDKNMVEFFNLDWKEQDVRSYLSLIQEILRGRTNSV